MMISVLLIFSSPSLETEVSSLWRFFLTTSSSAVLVESFDVVDVVGFTLEPRERGVVSLARSFDGVDERDVEASSSVESLKKHKLQTWRLRLKLYKTYDFLTPAFATFFAPFEDFSIFC